MLPNRILFPFFTYLLHLFHQKLWRRKLLLYHHCYPHPVQRFAFLFLSFVCFLLLQQLPLLVLPLLLLVVPLLHLLQLPLLLLLVVPLPQLLQPSAVHQLLRRVEAMQSDRIWNVKENMSSTFGFSWISMRMLIIRFPVDQMLNLTIVGETQSELPHSPNPHTTIWINFIALAHLQFTINSKKLMAF